MGSPSPESSFRRGIQLRRNLCSGAVRPMRFVLFTTFRSAGRHTVCLVVVRRSGGPQPPAASPGRFENTNGLASRQHRSAPDRRFLAACRRIYKPDPPLNPLLGGDIYPPAAERGLLRASCIPLIFYSSPNHPCPSRYVFDRQVGRAARRLPCYGSKSRRAAASGRGGPLAACPPQAAPLFTADIYRSDRNGTTGMPSVLASVAGVKLRKA